MFTRISKILTPNVREDVKQLGLPYIDDKVQNSINTLENSYEFFIKLIIHLIYNSEIPFLGIYLSENICLQKDLNTNVYSSLIHTAPNEKQLTCLSTGEWINTFSAVDNGLLLGHEKEQTTQYVVTMRMNLKM